MWCSGVSTKQLKVTANVGFLVGYETRVNLKVHEVASGFGWLATTTYIVGEFGAQVSRDLL